MIIDTIKNYRTYRNLAPEIDVALKYLDETDLASLAPGRYDIDGDNVYALVQHYTTEPELERLFEAHRAYFDIQYIAAGEEIIYWRPFAELGADIPYEEQNDCALVTSSGGTPLIMKKGMFAIFYPHDGHKPCCRKDGPEAVQKVVIKGKVT